MGENKAVRETATLTASVERSLQNCSLTHNQISGSSGSSSSTLSIGGGSAAAGRGGGVGRGQKVSGRVTVELNSHVPLPPDWEQFLDLQTGELSYIYWRTGVRVTEDPRLTTEAHSRDSSSEEDDSRSLDSESSSSELSPSSTSSVEQQWRDHHRDDFDVLVVAGCRRCLMYYMVPKLLEDCPKCFSQLLHF